MVFQVRAIMNDGREPSSFSVVIPTPSLVDLFVAGKSDGAAAGFGAEPKSLKSDEDNIVEVILERVSRGEEKKVLDRYDRDKKDSRLKN